MQSWQRRSAGHGPASSGSSGALPGKSGQSSRGWSLEVVRDRRLSRAGFRAHPASIWLEFVTALLAVTDRHRPGAQAVMTCVP